MSRTDPRVRPEEDQAPSETPPRRPRRREAFLAIVILVLGLAGYIASRLARLWPSFDVFSQFELQSAIMVAAGLIGLYMPRPKGAFAVGFLVFGLVLFGLWPNLQRPPSDAKAPDGMRSLRVASYNVDSANQTAQQVKAAVSGFDADVVLLNELTADDLPALQELSATWPYQAACTDFSVCDAGILSKYPLHELANNTDNEGASYVLARLGPDFGNTLLASVHTARFPHVRRQREELAGLAALLELRPGTKIIGGDFNATVTSRLLADFAANLGLTRTTRLPTWPARYELPMLAIDHFLASSGVGVLGEETLGPAAGSDHYPIIQSFSVPDNS